MSEPTNQLPPLVVQESPAAVDKPSLGRRLLRFLPAVLIVAFLVGITFPGVAYRRWSWDYTTLGRFKGDIDRNYTFGLSAMHNGFLNLYENEIRDEPDRGQRLDYPPLRLFTFEMWAKWNQHDFPRARHWSHKYEFTAPLLNYYTTLEWLASLAAMLIVLYWLRTCDRAELPLGQTLTPWSGVVRAMLAFSLLWFDPGVQIIAHGWPSPNMWAIPYYLWTALLCLWDFWFIAGLVMGVGVMLQGQLMFVAGLFLLWPIFAGRPVRALRWASGFFLAFMLVASGWMLTVRPDINLPDRLINWQALSWVVMSVVLLAVVGLRANLRDRFDWKWFLIPVGCAFIVLLLPALKLKDGATIGLTLLGALAVIGAFWYFSWKTKRYLLPLAIAACLLCCVPFFNGSTAWWEIGFLYGAERFPNVGGNMVNNLPSILEQLWGWRDIHDLAFTIPQGWFHGWPGEAMDVNIRQVLFTGYIVFFIAAGAAVAKQWRRKDRNLLIALVLPWVLFFTILPQMSPRYAVFVAGVGALCIGRAFGMTLLSLLFTALTIIQTATCMMMGSGSPPDSSDNWIFNPKTQQLFGNLNPGISWAEVLAACVFFWISFTNSRAKRRWIEPLAAGLPTHVFEIAPTEKSVVQLNSIGPPVGLDPVSTESRENPLNAEPTFEA